MSDFTTLLSGLWFQGVTPHQYRWEMRRDLCAHATGDLIQQLEALGIEIPPQDAGRETEGGAVVRERNAGMEDVRQAPVTQAGDDARLTAMMREMATLKNDVMYLGASFTVIASFVGLRRDEVVSAATQLLMQGNPVRSGAKAEAGGTKNAPHTPQRPSGRKRRDDSSPEEDGGDTSGHETVKAEEEEDLVSDTEDEEDGDDTCATKYTGVKLEKASGKFGVKILIKEGGKRKQQRLGAYTSEEEAAFAYAAGAFVLRPRDKIPNTVSLSAAEKAMLRGCTKEDLQLLVEARRWWRWRSWREAREGVNWKLKRGRKRVVATRTSKRQRVVDSNNKAANEPDDPDNAERGGTAPVHNGSGGCARHNEAEEGVEYSVAHEKLADHPA
ncbi:unnamed protein product [Closterium sp. Naga37s-1]|nr:unnamed protein product [Closterium sp. Naga37s-1]